MKRLLIPMFIALIVSGPAWGVEYDCPVTHKLDGERVYSAEQLKRFQPVVKISDRGKAATLSRCSFSPSRKKVTCDSYETDKIVFDKNVKIKKYYVFSSQFDVQLYNNLLFVENNGRGTIAYGKCHVVSP
jgi:hypothetical protein